jgi:hypothetical protein
MGMVDVLGAKDLSRIMDMVWDDLIPLDFRDVGCALTLGGVSKMIPQCKNDWLLRLKFAWCI